MKSTGEKIVLTEFQQHIINDYCDNDMRKLKKMYDPILTSKYVRQMDWDEAYSRLANTLVDSLLRYDASLNDSFDLYYRSNGIRTINTLIRDLNRPKRRNYARDRDGTLKKDENGKLIPIPDLPLDAKTEDGLDVSEKVSTGRTVEDDWGMKKSFSLEMEIREYSPEVQEYLYKLSRIQRKILELKIQGYGREEIMKILNIESNLYKDSIEAITACDKTRKLRALIRRANKC